MDAYCNPDWHDGEKIDADYLVRGADADGNPDKVTIIGNTFACCRRHLEPAVHVILARSPRALVREEVVDTYAT